ncbi:MAG: glucose 1-dehydrogenase [Desulfobacterales bacterium]|nr:glucose 1-dehydrogenase [Desulfobacterales bacterium]
MFNKVAVITGAGSGIGRATALLFAKKGAKVLVVDLDSKEGSKTVDSIEGHGGEARLVVADVSKASNVQRMVKTILELYGRLDILVNNAGIFTEGSVVETVEEEWDRVLGVNLLGVFLCMKYCIPEMIKGGGGVIVNVGSEAGLVGIRNQVAYNVSKSGVIALTKSTALDFAENNIRVNCLCPGRVLTPLVEKVISDSEDPEATRRILSDDRPLKRMGTPEDIAAGILFLASDETPYATGTVLSIDGGYTAQ